MEHDIQKMVGYWKKWNMGWLNKQESLLYKKVNMES